MDVILKKTSSTAFRFSSQAGKKEVGHAYLYLIYNDHYKNPYGFMEDVFVEESHRGSGVGTELVQKIIEKAKEENCYKLLGTSRRGRERVHALYTRLGFVEWGKEFRMNL